MESMNFIILSLIIGFLAKKIHSEKMIAQLKKEVEKSTNEVFILFIIINCNE